MRPCISAYEPPARLAWCGSRGPRCVSVVARRRLATGLGSALDELAAKHRILPKDINYAVEGYADDMLSVAIYVERALERELEREDPV